MKTILLYLTVFTTILLNAQTTQILDANFENKLIALGIDTNGITGDILDVDAQAVVNLDVSNSFINDLTGIEAFTNLTSLNCSNNNIAVLNTTLNNQLTNLNCSQNAITSLDISTNFNLQILNCSFNSLNNLLIPFNNNLVELYCVANHIGFLQIAAKIFLEKLECGLNNLHDLDVSANVNLSHLSAYTNNIGAIDVSNNVNLTYLSVANNQLNNLDVTNNIALTYLSVTNNQLNNLNVTNNIALTNLYCATNNLTKLNVSTNTQLTRLNCQINQLNTLDVRNGVNLHIPTANFNATNNNLTCIKVDEVAFATANWTNIDAGVTFDLSCEPVTLIPDNGFEQNLINQGIDTNGLTGTILNSDAQAVINLDVSNDFNISNISGIEAFTNLQTLNVSNTNLFFIDVSQNILLQNLDCHFTFFNDLDLSNNVNLTTLNCSDSQLFGELDLSQNVLLTSLDAHQSHLEKINIQNGNNHNISNAQFNTQFNFALTCIQVDDVMYSQNNWLQIDNTTTFSLNCNPVIVIPDVNFENALIALGIDTNGFTGDLLLSDTQWIFNLDVSNQNIQNLTGIEAFIDLTILNCSNNQITSLDVSQNVALNQLHCNNNNLNTLSMHSNLSFLHCQNNQLQNLDVSTNTSMYNLNCSHNSLQTLLMNQNSNLQRLNCNNNLLNVLDVSSITKLKELDCSFNAIQNLDVTASVFFLDKILCNNNQLTTLNLRNGNNNIISTANFNATNNNLTCIKVDEVAFATANWTNIDAGVTFDLFCEPVTLIPDNDFELKLINLGIDTNGFTGDILNSDAAPVINLDISSFGIEEITGIEAFISLQELDASYNNIGVNGLVDFSQNVDLRILDLQSNDVATIDVSQNNALTYLNLNSNTIANIDVSNNIDLINLNASSNALINIDLSNNILLEVLHLKNNNLTRKIHIKKTKLGVKSLSL